MLCILLIIVILQKFKIIVLTFDLPASLFPGNAGGPSSYMYMSHIWYIYLWRHSWEVADIYVRLMSQLNQDLFHATTKEKEECSH